MGKQTTIGEKIMKEVPLEPENSRMMPILHKDQYYLSELSQNAITPDEKVEFLTTYYKTGNLTKSARSVGRHIAAFRQHVETDKAFAVDFFNVKEAIKNDLEETMLTNALKEKGYMDRITWLRTNFPQEYNPNAIDRGEDKTQDVIKQLSQKLDEYQLIPKKSIITPEEPKA